MGTLQFLNAFISERLAAAAVEIFGAVEKTLIEYQGEISRSKEEIDHLRTLVLWPEVKLHRAGHRVTPQSCDEEGPPEQHHCDDEWSPNVSQEHPNALLIKQELDVRADQRGLSSRQKSDTIVCPPFVKRECHQHSPPPLHLYRILTVEHNSVSTTEDIKAEPDGDGFVTSPSTGEAESPCGINPECSGVERETLQGSLEIAPHGYRSPETQYCEQDWSPCQDHEDSDAPQIKKEKFALSGPEESDKDCKLPIQCEKSVYDKPHCSSPSQDQTLRYRTFYPAKEMTRDPDGENYQLSRSSRVCQSIFSVNPDYTAAHGEYVENAAGVENGEWLKALKPKGTRTKKRQTSNSCTEGREESFSVEGDVKDLARERRHTCPICRKRFKESSHLRDHVRIHTGEKPFQCKECGMNFRQSGALTLHMRTHTGERPYQCSDCGRRFNRKGDMETHRVTHTGERPHQCLACGKSFRRKSNLNTHLKTHAEEKMDYTEPL
ncbi:zinc finger and SCAN domain-containing protein 2-like [Myripristis murdjan]|uniref:zinc finger and SCAN domain-containing protein 2-like n=1 Tax=Myripristis murdjan TaxID=586833 RepID=UPI0011762433|nr:zinc finger and SCAN domain-containing protein 2-like [Myripristis murdjan]